MRRYRFTYFLGQCFKSLWRNGVMTIASIVVLMGCLIVMGSFELLVVNINKNLEGLARLNEIVIFIKEDRTEEEALAFGEKIEKWPSIEKIEFISNEQALEEEKAKYADYADLYELVEGDNPLRDSFTIWYKDGADVESLVWDLEHEDDVAKVNNRQNLASSIEDVKSGVSSVLIWFMIILFAVSVLVIINTIKLAVHARRTEISIMRYIGASRWFVMLPFILEGIFIGIFASVFAFLIEWYIYDGYVVNMVGSDFSFIEILDFSEVGPMLAIAFLGIGVVTGIIGSTISTRKHLKA